MDQSAQEGKTGGTGMQRILTFSENHPYILLGTVVILVLAVIIMYLNSRGIIGGSDGFKKSKKKKTNEEKDLDEEEIDDLINDINEKQKKNKRKRV